MPPTSSTRRRTATPLAPLEPDAFGEREARHLLWRAGFGGTRSQIRTLAGWGLERSVDYLVNFEQVPADEPAPGLFDKDIMRPPTMEEEQLIRRARSTRDEDLLAKLRTERQRRQREDRKQIRAMQEWWLTRMIETARPLEEKLTLFWHGHFATGYRTIENSYHMFMQNQLFRAHAVGNFGELAFAMIRDPAMLAYLDNNDSRKDQPNENLARELMELFTLGEGAYSERDIKEGARALTGFSFEDDAFVFRNNNHDYGIKTILGTQGSLDGDGFVRAILETRACSRFIGAKLYDYFCRSVPLKEEEQDAGTRAIVRAMAGTMLRNRYEIKPVLRELFMSKHFYSDGVVGEQIKSPAALVVGAVRSLGTPVRDLALLNDALGLMGQALFQPPNVKGWEGGRSWINTSTLFVRQNTLAFLLTGKAPGVRAKADLYDPTALVRELAGERAGDPRAAAEAIARFTLGRESERATAELMALAKDAKGEMTPALGAGMLLLATALPEYQLC